MMFELQNKGLTLEDERQRDIDRLRRMEASERLETINPARGLRDLRLKVDVSQEVFAKQMGVSRRAYQTYETGSRNIPSNALAKLLAQYDFDIYELFTGDPAPVFHKTKQKIAMRAVETTMYIFKNFPKCSLPEIKDYVGKFAAIENPDRELDLQALYWLIVGDAGRSSDQQDYHNRPETKN